MASLAQLLWLLPAAVLASPPVGYYYPINDTQASARPVCEEIMASSGLNFSSFWHGAAHGIHSINLEEIWEFFESEATVNNKIPVVNEDLSASQTILFDAPLAGYDKDFQTMSMKVMAYFMLHDKPALARQGINTLEKVVHQYHMHQIYAAAAPLYRRIKRSPPANQELCPCVNDVTGNGILTELVRIAKELKYGAIYGQRSRGAVMEDKEQDLTLDEMAHYEREYLEDSTPETAKRLLGVKPWLPNTFKGPEQWVSFEAMLTTSMPDKKELNDFAYFMYCKLNRPELDHPRELFTMLPITDKLN